MSVDDEETLDQPLLASGQKTALQNGQVHSTPARLLSTDPEQALPLLEDEPSSSGWPTLSDICAVRGMRLVYDLANYSRFPLSRGSHTEAARLPPRSCTLPFIKTSFYSINLPAAPGTSISCSCVRVQELGRQAVLALPLGVNLIVNCERSCHAFAALPLCMHVRALEPLPLCALMITTCGRSRDAAACTQSLQTQRPPYP